MSSSAITIWDGDLNLSDIIPPTESDQKPSSDVFNRPKVESKEEDGHNCDKYKIGSEHPAKNKHHQS
jgi:hypothetical protein